MYDFYSFSVMLFYDAGLIYDKLLMAIVSELLHLTYPYSYHRNYLNS